MRKTTTANMDARIPSNEEFPRYPVVIAVYGDEKQGQRNNVSRELGRGEGGEMVARFPACPHMTVLRPGLADAATLCACHSCPSTADEAVSRTMTLF